MVQGKARYIVNPASPTPKLITASDGTWKQTVFVKERGHYQEYRIEGSKGYTLQIGDIVWSDGSFTKSVEYDKFYNKRPIGIIGYLGNDNVVDGKTDENGKRRYSHGIIVATWGIQSQYANNLYVKNMAATTIYYTFSIQAGGTYSFVMPEDDVQITLQSGGGPE